MLELFKAYDFVIGDNADITAIFIHGIASDTSSYGGLFEYFKEKETPKNVRVVAFDLLGAGGSPASDKFEYNIDEQITALEKSIKAANIIEPFVMVGHSMGTFIATRYASLHKEDVKKLVLISAPTYTPENLKDPAFKAAFDNFKQKIEAGNPEMVGNRAFNNELKYIVMNPENYDVLANIQCDTTIIYGKKDQIIASFNIPALKKLNPCIKAVKTPDGHGVSAPKYKPIIKALEN